ncbi:MAG TPA: substrate-binding domain-containing protein [Thermoplasmata archaeon]|nr:substrate-binding domain-containing protein [Thermoplasmata archaeon]
MVAVVVVGGVVAYVYLRPAPSNSSGPSGPVSITAAGTLGTLFPQVASAYANATSGVAAPLASQQYQGSLAALASITTLHQKFDIAAAADFRLIPKLLEPTYATCEVVFATTPEVLAYDPSNAALSGITASNWPSKITQSGFHLAIANASTDPNGYNEIFVLELEGNLTGQGLGGLYGHFFTTAVGALAVPNPASTIVEPETQAATLITTHQVGAFIIYRSYAVAHHLSFIDFDPHVGLGNLTLGAAGAYSAASTSILTANGTALLHGAPVAFAATVPSNAPSNAVGMGFLSLLLSATGTQLITADGFTAITPAWSDHPSALGGLSASVVALPPSLAADLSG